MKSKVSLFWFVILLFFCRCTDTQIESVKIGNQVWMTKNLNVSTFRNGDLIPEAKTGDEWITAAQDGKPAWCYWDNDPSNGKKYGKLYNWYAVIDKRCIAPIGWHVPSSKEWTQLIENIGKNDDPGLKLKSTNGWRPLRNGNNSSGFTGLPGGIRLDANSFANIERDGNWWDSTDDGSPNVMAHTLGFAEGVSYYNGIYDRRLCGMSIRCVKNF